MNDFKISIYEDEAVIALDLAKSLKEVGFTKVFSFLVSEELIKDSVASPPSIIIADINYKKKVNGVVAVKQIRENLNIKVPVIFVSADNPQELGLLDEKTIHIKKPFKFTELTQEIERLLSSAQA